MLMLMLMMLTWLMMVLLMMVNNDNDCEDGGHDCDYVRGCHYDADNSDDHYGFDDCVDAWYRPQAVRQEDADCSIA